VITRITGAFALACLLLVGMATTASAEDVYYGASLTGAAEVGDAGGDADGSGIAAVDLNTETNEICFEITVSNIAAPTAGHIHVGGAGTNGPVVVNFDWPTTNGSGCVTSDAPTVAAIQNAPSLYYVNVHNEDYPGGAIRGQLSLASGATFTGGSAGGGELAFTGSSLTSIFAAAGGALVASGALMVRTAGKRRRV
jgi:hypothetical protein